jgi:hydroxymethylbilane synthase
VGTRIEKIVRGELDGVVLAAAGLRRLGKADSITHSFSFSECIPAIGQGALALECRASDAATARLLSALDDPLTAEAVKLERRFMKAVGGGCKVPMAAHAYPYGDGFRFLAAMGDASAGRRVRVERALDARFPEADVDDLAGEILEECAAAGLPTPRGA